nr:collagen alpha-2(I) chain-like [Saimiri boliviensis boliviensis]
MSRGARELGGVEPRGVRSASRPAGAAARALPFVNALGPPPPQLHQSEPGVGGEEAWPAEEAGGQRPPGVGVLGPGRAKGSGGPRSGAAGKLEARRVPAGRGGAGRGGAGRRLHPRSPRPPRRRSVRSAPPRRRQGPQSPGRRRSARRCTAPGGVSLPVSRPAARRRPGHRPPPGWRRRPAVDRRGRAEPPFGDTGFRSRGRRECDLTERDAESLAWRPVLPDVRPTRAAGDGGHVSQRERTALLWRGSSLLPVVHDRSEPQDVFEAGRTPSPRRWSEWRQQHPVSPSSLGSPCLSFLSFFGF